MNAKPGWSVFATVLCFAVVGVLTLNSYQNRLNQSGVAIGIRAEISDVDNSDPAVPAPDIVIVAAAASDDNQLSIAGNQTEPVATADEHSQLVVARPIFEAIECRVTGCGTEAALAGTAPIEIILIDQLRVAGKGNPGLSLDREKLHAMSTFATDIAHAALNRVGFSLARAEQPQKAEAKPILKTPAKLASFRSKKSNAKPQLHINTWTVSIEKLKIFQRSFITNLGRVASQLKAKHQLERMKSTLQALSAEVNASWFGRFIRQVVMPRLEVDEIIDLNFNTYAIGQTSTSIELVNYVMFIDDEDEQSSEESDSAVDSVLTKIEAADSDDDVAGIEIDFGGETTEESDDELASDEPVSVFELEFGDDDESMMPEVEDFADIDADSEINVAVSDSDADDSDDDRRRGKFRERLQKVRSRIESRRESTRRIEGRRAESRRSETR